MLAQVEEQFLPSEQKHMTAVTEPATLGKGFVRMGLNYSYCTIKTIFNNEAEKELVPGAASEMSNSIFLSAQYGITNRIEASLYIPYVMDKINTVLLVDYQITAPAKLLGEVKGFGLGDVYTGVKAQAILEQEWWPSVTVGTYLKLPTGRKSPSNVIDLNQYDKATGSGEISLEINMQARKIVYPYSFTFLSGYEYRFGGMKVHAPFEEVKTFKSGNFYYAIGGINFHLNDWICVTNDLTYSYKGRNTLEQSLTGNISSELLWTPNIHFQIKRLRLAQGFMVPLMGRNAGADPRYLLILQYIL